MQHNKPSGVAAAQAAATDIGFAMQTVEGFPTKQLQWEMVGKDTDGTPIYRNNWGAYSHWVPVSERLPEPYAWVLAWDGGPPIPYVCYVDPFGVWKSAAYRTEHPGPTHWMPLPGPPDDE